MNTKRMTDLLIEFREARIKRAQKKEAWDEAAAESRRVVRDAREAYDKAADALEQIEEEMETGQPREPLFGSRERSAPEPDGTTALPADDAPDDGTQAVDPHRKPRRSVSR